jgi:nucleoside 2-deoxyribosyltransferase
MENINCFFTRIERLSNIFKPKKKIVYLGGTITQYFYREYAKKYVEENNLQIILTDPFQNEFFNVKIENENDVILAIDKIRSYTEIENIVERDLLLLKRSDILIAFIEKLTAGTIMEMVYAKILGKKIYVINPKFDLWNDIWLSYHTDKFFKTIEDCFNHIKQIK